MLEGGRDRVQRQKAGAPGSKLDRERQPIQAATDGSERWQRVSRRLEIRPDSAHAIDEQPNGAVLFHAAGYRLLRYGERRHRIPMLRLQTQRSATGDHDRQPRTRREHLSHVRGGLDDVLEVVEDDKDVTISQLGDQLLQRIARPDGRARCSPEDRRHNEACLPQRCQ